MKVKIEMIVEISKENAENWDIESHVRDALSMYEGNEIEFWDCKIESVIPEIKKFEEDYAGMMLVCLETFEAKHTNSICGELITNTQAFIAGCEYRADSWRPEGMRVGNFFVFNKDACKFAVLG